MNARRVPADLSAVALAKVEALIDATALKLWGSMPPPYHAFLRGQEKNVFANAVVCGPTLWPPARPEPSPVTFLSILVSSFGSPAFGA